MTIEILKKEDTFCISRKNLAIYLGISKQHIISYSKENLYSPSLQPIDKEFYAIKGSESWYDFTQAIMWHKDNISQKHSPKKNKYTGLQDGEGSTHEEYDGITITTANAREAKELESARNEQNKRILSDFEIKVQDGRYKSTDILDKAMAEYSILVLSELRNFKDGLPHEMQEVADEHIEAMVIRLHEEVNRYENG